MSHLTQMLGLGVHNFVSAAAGLAIMAALIRGLARRRASTSRQLLGRPDPLDHPHPAADLLHLRPGDGEPGVWSRTSTASPA